MKNKNPLSDTKIRTAKAKDHTYGLPDERGLRLEVTPSGGKLWRWKYRFRGKEKLMALGKYPEVSLADAREHRDDGRRLLGKGTDPMAARKSSKALKVAEAAATENTFAVVSAKWMEHWSEGKTIRHVDSVGRRMKADILPCIGALPIDEIEAPALVAMVKAIEQRGARDIAKRALETSGQVFRYGIAHGFCRRNPAADIRPRDILRATRKTNYARIDAKELPDLLRRIEVYRGTPLTRLAIKLMALTFVRTGELIGARWSEFDLNEARWDIPAERMKMRTSHIVPLSRQALEVLALLRELPRAVDSQNPSGKPDLLFPGDRTWSRPMSNNTILKALDRMGYKGRMTGHGFRGLASTLLHEQGYPHDYIELQLAHAPRNSVSAAYNHALHLKARTKMMQDWADHLEQTQRGAKVLIMREGVA